MGSTALYILADDKNYRIDEHEADRIMQYMSKYEFVAECEGDGDEDKFTCAENTLLQWFDKDGDAFVLSMKKLDAYCSRIVEKALSNGRKYEGASGLLSLRYLLGDFHNFYPVIVHKGNDTEGSMRTLNTLYGFVNKEDRLYLVDVKRIGGC